MDRSGAMARPTLWLAPLLLVILAGGWVAPWSSVATVDERTYLEMALGFQETGLPLIENGPVELFTSLQARWNLHREGQLWGVMSPGFPFLSTGLMRLGGIQAVLQANLLLLALLAIAVYRIGREITGDPETGVAAAYVALISIPLWTSSFGFLPYSLAMTGYAWALFCAVRAQTTDRWTWALASGLLAGLATSSQLLIFPMLVGLVAALAWSRVRLAMLAAIGALPCLGAMGWLNSIRFGSWNPLSDGPCVWQGCPDSGADPQSVGQMITAVLPVLGWLIAAGLLFWFLRDRAPRTKLLGAVSILIPLIVLVPIRDGLLRYGLMTWRLLIDVGAWPDAENTTTTPDGLGLFIGPHVVKSLLQGSPALVLAVAARLARVKLALLWLPIFGLFLMLVLRASMPVDLALGHPFLNLRYLMPAAAPLAILATIGARRLQWRLPHLALATLVAAVLRWTFWNEANDLEVWRRVLLLRVSLWVALALTLMTWLAIRRGTPAWNRGATVLAAIAFGWGAGVSVGVDLAASIRLRDQVQTLVDDLDHRLPQRFALIGYPDRLDAPLTLKAHRDIQYLDLKEVKEWSESAGPIRWWLAEERPIFALLAPGEVVEAPDDNLILRTIDAKLGLIEVVPRPASDSIPEPIKPTTD